MLARLGERIVKCLGQARTYVSEACGDIYHLVTRFLWMHVDEGGWASPWNKTTSHPAITSPKYRPVQHVLPLIPGVRQPVGFYKSL